jgi:hypothetical protein
MAEDFRGKMRWIVYGIVAAIIFVNIIQYVVIPAVQEGKIALLSPELVGGIAGAGVLLFLAYIFIF